MTSEHEILVARLDERYKSLDEKLDTILDQIKFVHVRVDGHQDKIHQLFNWQSEIKGNWKATTAIGAIVGGIVSYIASLFWGK